MRRYLPLLLLSVFLVIVALGGLALLESHADEKNNSNEKHINVYTSLPLEQASIIAQEYEKAAKVRVNMIPVPEQELNVRLSNNENGDADVVLATQLVLAEMKKAGRIVPYQSEQTDIIPERFKDRENYWTGIWYDPVVFVVNNDFIKNYGLKIAAWNDLIQDKPLRIGITDFVTARSSANLLYSMTAVNGEQQTISYLKKLHPRVVQYAKFLATPIRMAGLGECDVAIAVQSEAVRYVKDGFFPIGIVYPEDGTAALVTGAALVTNLQHGAEAKAFIDWLAGDNIHTTMQQQKYYFMPTNPDAHWVDGYPRNIKLFDIEKMITPPEQQRIVDLWIKTVRFSTN